MITELKVTEKKLKDIVAECEIVLVVNKNLKHKWISDFKELKLIKFDKGATNLHLIAKKGILYVATESLDSEDIRLAVSRSLNAISSIGYKTLKIGMYTKKSYTDSMRAIVEGFILGGYSFTKYKSTQKDKIKTTIYISTQEYKKPSSNDIQTLKKELIKSRAIADATNYTKDISNATPEDITPKTLASVAEKLSSHKNIKFNCYDEKFLKENGMEAFLAVGRASINKPRLIHLTYTPKAPKKRVIFVGKGITYDSGGLSLKPPRAMVTMKADKSGAASALGIIKAAADIDLDIEVHAILGAAENMVGGNAYKPDDVLKAKNSKTIEVRNTDAEGRLVLADCLCYAQDFKPDYIVDLATLTGACLGALGEYTTGAMGNSKRLIDSFIKVASKSGELVSRLDFNRYLREMLKSDIADIANIAKSPYAGAQEAGIFLDNFIKNKYKNKWIHLDIAGPAYLERAWGYNQYGASGAGVRMCLYWLEHLASS